MIRLIDQIALLERMRRVYVQKYAGATGGTAFADAIKMVQTSNRHCGRWEKRDKTANRFCSECGGKITKYTGQKFCEHCGCPMNGDVKKGEA